MGIHPSKWPFVWKLYAGYVVLIAMTAVVVWSTVVTTITTHMQQDMRISLSQQLVLLEEVAKQVPQDRLQERLTFLGKNSDVRFTVVTVEGHVLADSQRNPNGMDNHGGRPEFREAAEGDGVIASSTRYSRSLGRDMFYMARAMMTDVGDVLGYVRVSRVLRTVEQEMAALGSRVALVILAVVVFALMLGYGVASRITAPLRRLTTTALEVADMSDENLPKQRDEIAQLGVAVNSMKNTLEERISTIEYERENLQRLQTVRQDFITNISHELKTPLTAMRGLLETVIDDPEMPSEVSQRFINNAHVQSLRMSALVTDLLTLTSIESDAYHAEVEDFNISVLVSSAMDAQQETAKRKGITLTYTNDCQSCMVHADREAIRQIVDNLISNAIRYSPEDRPVRLVLCPSAGSRCEIRVIDQGFGIPEEMKERIFERFFRVDKARSRELGGTGLGLSIVKHLVQVNNGTIALESQEGVGSTFIVTLPLS